MRRFNTSATLLATLVLSASVSAQIQTQPTEIIRATPLTAFSERAGSWPVTVISGDVTASEVETLDRFLNTLPGVQARRSGSPVLSIRGSAQAARTLRLFDSVPLVFADGFGAPEALLPTEILGELRLVKGPASVFYGPYAMAGALNHIPRIYHRPGIRLAADDEDGGLSTLNAFGVLPLIRERDDDTLQFTAFTENRPGDYPFESKSTGIRGRRRNNKTQTNRYTLIGEQKRGDLTFRERIVHADTMGTNPNILTSPDPSSFVRHSTLAAIDVRAKLGAAADLGVQTSYLRHYSRDHSAYCDSFSDARRSLLAVDYGHVFEGNWRSRTFVDLAYDTLQANCFLEGNYNQTDFQLGEVLEVPLTSLWTLQPGARWLSRHGRVFSSLALIREDVSLRAWLTYSEGFRSPFLYDRFARSLTAVPNPSLQPESSRQVELGVLGKPAVRHRTFMEGFSWSATLYAVEYRDFFDNQPVSTTASTKVNRGEAYAYGGDLTTGFAEGSRTYSLGYSHLQGKNRATGEPLTLPPRHQATAAVTQGLGPALLELRQTYTSKIYDREYPSNVLRPLPDWSSLDVTVRTIGMTDWEIKAGVLNIFDRPRELTIGYPEPQRTFYVSALRFF